LFTQEAAEPIDGRNNSWWNEPAETRHL